MIRIALVLTLLVACTGRVETPPVEKAPPPAKAVAAPAAPIRTDRSSYVLTNGPRGPEAIITAMLRAPADQALYIINCNGQSSVTLQQKVGDAWEYALIVASAACLSPPIVVPPGGEHTASIHLHADPGSVPGPRRGRLESGTYRVIWTGVLTSFDANKRGFGPELPEEQRVSAPFTIEVPPAAQLTVAAASDTQALRPTSQS